MALAADSMNFSSRPIWTIMALSMLAMAAIQASPAAWQEALRYDRAAIRSGELWRLVTGHFVHLGWPHLALNLAGLVLGTWLFGRDRSPRQWLVATLVSALATGIGLWWFSPTIEWCVGLSGVLHGLMVVGFGGWLLAGERWAWWFFAIIVGKLTWEQLGGDMPWANSLAGGTVVTDAHLWGAAGGAIFLAVDTAWRRLGARV
jgi:rhomboid family GlyGly-CTERM serine protease